MNMNLKAPLCPICGGKVSWLLPATIEDEHICDDCYGKIDMERHQHFNLTMAVFRDYLQFFEQNQPLKDSFILSEHFDFGYYNAKMIFDYQHQWFCMSSRPDRTVFESKHLQSFVIRADEEPVFTGTREGIRASASKIETWFDPNRVNGDGIACKAFHIELKLEHPYWSTIAFSFNAPKFEPESISMASYKKRCEQAIGQIEQLVIALSMMLGQSDVQRIAPYMEQQANFL